MTGLSKSLEGEVSVIDTRVDDIVGRLMLSRLLQLLGMMVKLWDYVVRTITNQRGYLYPSRVGS